jgi:hypothetical protein
MADARRNDYSTGSIIGDTGASIQIERLAEGATIVRVTYPDDLRRKGARGLGIICVCLCLLPIIAWFCCRSTRSEGFWVIGAAVVAIYGMVNAVRQFVAVTCSYVFRADRDGLMIEKWNGRRTRSWQFTRNQIDDIILGFGYYRGPNSLFRCWMTIVTGRFREIRCLQNLGGNHLGPIADALRAGLGMPKRSWP